MHKTYYATKNQKALCKNVGLYITKCYAIPTKFCPEWNGMEVADQMLQQTLGEENVMMSAARITLIYRPLQVLVQSAPLKNVKLMSYLKRSHLRSLLQGLV